MMRLVKQRLLMARSGKWLVVSYNRGDIREKRWKGVIVKLRH